MRSCCLNPTWLLPVRAQCSKTRIFSGLLSHDVAEMPHSHLLLSQSILPYSSGVTTKTRANVKPFQPRHHLQVLRHTIGLSQTEMAYLIGSTDRASVVRIEKGSHHPNLFQALLMELVFGARIDKLFPAVRRKAKEAAVRRLRAIERKLIARANRRKRVSLIVARLSRIRARLEGPADDQASDQQE